MDRESNPSGYPIPRWLKEKQGTGRTTRMLEAVKDNCRDGISIFVVMPDSVMAKSVQRSFERMILSVVGWPPFEQDGSTTRWNGAQVIWASCRDQGWNWKTMRLDGIDPICLVFVDPSCIEMHFHHLIEAWHRFDEAA